MRNIFSELCKWKCCHAFMFVYRRTSSVTLVIRNFQNYLGIYHWLLEIFYIITGIAQCPEKNGRFPVSGSCDAYIECKVSNSKFILLLKITVFLFPAGWHCWRETMSRRLIVQCQWKHLFISMSVSGRCFLWGTRKDSTS